MPGTRCSPCKGPRQRRYWPTSAQSISDDLKYYWFAAGEVAGVRATVSRTGYTGEDGFEIFLPPAQAARVWDALLLAGASVDIRPCGLGARDTLRLESCMRLYGNDMDESVTVLEAGLGWVVGWDKPAFLGLEACAPKASRASRAESSPSKCATAPSRGTATSSCVAANPCGRVTSGTQTPFLQKAVGLAMVPADMAAVDRNWRSTSAAAARRRASSPSRSTSAPDRPGRHQAGRVI